MSRHKCYDLVAISAGLQRGMDLPSVAAVSRMKEGQRAVHVAAVADDPEAVELRDQLVEELDRRLADSGYDGHQVEHWFHETYGPIAHSSICRARGAVRARESRVAETAAEARAYVDLGREGGADSIFQAASGRAAQLIFQLLQQLKAADLKGADADPRQVVRILDALAKLQRSRAETDLIRVRLDEARREFDAAVARAAGAGEGDGKLSRDDIDSIRRAVFGEAA